MSHLATTETVAVGDRLFGFVSPVAKVERERVCDHRGNFTKATVALEDGSTRELVPGYAYSRVGA